jgi:alpha-L-fucosidase
MTYTKTNLTLFLSAIISLIIATTSCKQVPPPAPVEPLPSARQLAWHELEFYGFVHFNMNTFTNIEWGYGGEKPETFNPTELDTRQWCKTFKDAGMKGVILTCKHHDGFCLWPTKTTEHSVKNSPYKNGKGDVVKELSEACKEYGLKFGVYLSPWDRNNEHYGTEKYIDIFREQLRELLTNYGEVFEVWFDGANGGTGYYGGADEKRTIDRKTYYDWENTYKIVRELQPNAVLFSDAGPDIRWVGNESGWAKETNWSLLKRDEAWPGWPRYKELQSGHEDGTHWLPAEVDVSIRPGWYYHKSEDHKVKSLPHLLDIYYHSIGRNASFLLNFPVDQRGLVHEKDVEGLMALANAIKADLETDLAKGKEVSASNNRGRRYSAKKSVDGKKETYWATEDNITEASLTIDFGSPTLFNRFLVQEFIALGQRVQEFTLEAEIEGEWKEIASETTIGYKRILRLDPVEATKVRLNIKKSKACPTISNIEIYNAPKVLIEPDIKRNKEGLVEISAFDKSTEIRYTTDGSEPNNNSTLYEKPFNQLTKGTVKAISYDPEADKSSPVASIDFDICKAKWTLMEVDSERGLKTIDDVPESVYFFRDTKFPVDVMVDLGEVLNISGFTYLPDQSRGGQGIISTYEFYISKDGKRWGKPLSKGEFSNIKNSPVWQKKTFAPSKGRYLKLRALSTTTEEVKVGVAEIGVITE